MGNVNQAAIDPESSAPVNKDKGRSESLKRDLQQPINATTLENQPAMKRQRLGVESPLIIATEPVQFDDNKPESCLISTPPRLLLDPDSTNIQALASGLSDDTLAKASDSNISNDSNTSFPLLESDLPECFDTSLDLNSAGPREIPKYLAHNDLISQHNADQDSATPEMTSLTTSMSRIELAQGFLPPNNFSAHISSPCKADRSIVLSTETNEPMLIDFKPPSPITFDSVPTPLALTKDPTAKSISAADNASIRIPLVTTYADAMNLASRFPELASEILVQPLSTEPDEDALRNLFKASRTNDTTPIVNQPPIAFAMPAHTADRPNWALAPDTVRPLHRQRRRNKRNEQANWGSEADKSREIDEDARHAQRGDDSHVPQKNRTKYRNVPVTSGHERTTYQCQHTLPQSNSDSHERPPHLPTATDSNSITVSSSFNRSAEWEPTHSSWVSGRELHLDSHQTHTNPEGHTQPPYILATRVLPLNNLLDAPVAPAGDQRHPQVVTSDGNSSRGTSLEVDRPGVTPSSVSSQNDSLHATKNMTEQYLKMRKQQVAGLKIAAYRHLGGRSDCHVHPKKNLSGGEDPNVHADCMEAHEPEKVSLLTELAVAPSSPSPASETVPCGDKHENPSSGGEDTRLQNGRDSGKALPEWRRRCEERSSSPKYVPPPVALSRRVSPAPLNRDSNNAKSSLADNDISKLDRPPSRENYPFRDIHLRTNNVDPITHLTSEKLVDMQPATFDTVLDVRPPSQSGVAALAASRASKIFDRGGANEATKGVGIDRAIENIPVGFNSSVQGSTGWIASVPNKPTSNAFPPSYSLLKSKLNPLETVDDGSPLSQSISDDHDTANEKSRGVTPPFELHHHLQSTTVNWFSGRESFTVDSSLGASQNQALAEAEMRQFVLLPGSRSLNEVLDRPDNPVDSTKQEWQTDGFSGGSRARHDRPTDSAFRGRENRTADLFPQVVDPRCRRQSQPSTGCGGFGFSPGGNREIAPFTSGSHDAPWPLTGTEVKEQHVDSYNELIGRKRKGEVLGGEFGKRGVDFIKKQTPMPQRSASSGVKHFISSSPNCNETPALILIGSGARRVSEGTKGKWSKSEWV